MEPCKGGGVCEYTHTYGVSGWSPAKEVVSVSTHIHTGPHNDAAAYR